MGVVLGIIIAVIAMGRVLMYPEQGILFAVTVGITVLFIIMAGCTVGSMLPIILKRLGIDPRRAPRPSSPASSTRWASSSTRTSPAS